MSITLDKNISSNEGAVLATLPDTSEGDLILHFYSFFDDFEELVVVEDVRQVGNWIEFEMLNTQIPNRSGSFRIELHTTSEGVVPLDQLYQPFDTIASPIDDIVGFRKDALVAETVGEILNATNTLFKKHGRSITYTDKERTTTFKSQTRDVEYKTNF